MQKQQLFDLQNGDCIYVYSGGHLEAQGRYIGVIKDKTESFLCWRKHNGNEVYTNLNGISVETMNENTAYLQNTRDTCERGYTDTYNQNTSDMYPHNDYNPNSDTMYEQGYDNYDQSTSNMYDNKNYNDYDQNMDTTYQPNYDNYNQNANGMYDDTYYPNNNNSYEQNYIDTYDSGYNNSQNAGYSYDQEYNNYNQSYNNDNPSYNHYNQNSDCMCNQGYNGNYNQNSSCRCNQGYNGN
ncbi:hypothetical protein [Bacillus thuringiensis]|uniref:hypothetical protein n=1 Tax=Bacillus thuringiensis TaxID=1428 RepID=UPI001F5BF75D|nr:hypothetical protein [Bacillus thuringiensis]